MDMPSKKHRPPGRQALLSHAEARDVAKYLINKTPGPSQRGHVIDLLSDWSMLTGDQLRRWLTRVDPTLSSRWDSFDRSLTKFVSWQVIQILPGAAADLTTAGVKPLWPFAPRLYQTNRGGHAAGDIARQSDLRLRGYQLGAVGLAMVAEMGGRPPAPAKPAEALHNLLCAEVCLRIAEARPGVEVRGPRDLIWYDQSDSAAAATIKVAPDAWLKFPSSQAKSQVWLVEYMNEDGVDAKRLDRKILHYLQVLRPTSDNQHQWEALWHTAGHQPGVLFVGRSQRVLNYLKTEYSKSDLFAGLTLADALGGFPLNIHFLSHLRAEPDPATRQPTEAPAYQPAPPCPPLPPRARAKRLAEANAALSVTPPPPPVPSASPPPPPLPPAPAPNTAPPAIPRTAPAVASSPPPVASSARPAPPPPLISPHPMTPPAAAASPSLTPSAGASAPPPPTPAPTSSRPVTPPTPRPAAASSPPPVASSASPAPPPPPPPTSSRPMTPPAAAASPSMTPSAGAPAPPPPAPTSPRPVTPPTPRPAAVSSPPPIPSAITPAPPPPPAAAASPTMIPRTVTPPPSRPAVASSPPPVPSAATPRTSPAAAEPPHWRPLTLDQHVGGVAVAALVLRGQHNPNVVMSWLIPRGLPRAWVVSYTPAEGLTLRMDDDFQYRLQCVHGELRLWCLNRPTPQWLVRVPCPPAFPTWLADKFWQYLLGLWINAILADWDWPAELDWVWKPPVPSVEDSLKPLVDAAYAGRREAWVANEPRIAVVVADYFAYLNKQQRFRPISKQTVIELQARLQIAGLWSPPSLWTRLSRWLRGG